MRFGLWRAIAGACKGVNVNGAVIARFFVFVEYLEVGAEVLAEKFEFFFGPGAAEGVWGRCRFCHDCLLWRCRGRRCGKHIRDRAHDFLALGSEFFFGKAVLEGEGAFGVVQDLFHAFKNRRQLLEHFFRCDVVVEPVFEDLFHLAIGLLDLLPGTLQEKWRLGGRNCIFNALDPLGYCEEHNGGLYG